MNKIKVSVIGVGHLGSSSHKNRIDRRAREFWYVGGEEGGDDGGDVFGDVVMAGLDRLDAKAGQSVQMGEPVGVMPDWQPGGPGRRPSLYVELRHDGNPVNPAPWLRTSG